MKTQIVDNVRWMAVAVFVLAILDARIVDADTFDHSHEQFTRVLKQHVEDGLVDYSGLHANRGELDEYLKSLASVPLKRFQSWTMDQQLAFLINLYNAQTLKLILEHFPVKSIKDIGSFLRKPWDLEVVDLFGNIISLNTVEHGMIRKHYSESRIHFALVCAARGCPELRTEAYQADKLNEQLAEQAQTFFGDHEKNRIDLENKILYLSPIFKWYAEDFAKNSQSIASYVSHYFHGDIARRLQTEKFKIRYTEYDWSLNSQRQGSEKTPRN